MADNNIPEGIIIREKDISDLRYTSLNPVKRNDKAKKAIRNSIREVGLGRSIVIDENDVIMAGNGTVEGAKEEGYQRVIEIETDGKTLVAVKRTNLSEDDKLRYGLWDNSTAKNAMFDKESLQEYIKRGIDPSPVISQEDLDKYASNKKDAKGDNPDDTSFGDDQVTGYYLVIEAEDEKTQEELFEYLQEEGYKVIKYSGAKKD